MSDASDRPLFIAGAGPTGLSLALSLAARGHSPRIVDRQSGPVEQSRALAVQARTLEFYRALGVADGAVQLGTRARRAHVMSDGQEVTAFSLADMGEGLSPYPFMLILAQDAHERYLVDRLAEHGVEVEWNTTLTGFEADADGVTVALETDDGSAEAQCDYLVGCDGANSAVRRTLGLGFAGGTNEGLFYVADVDTDRPSDDIFAAFGHDTLALMFPVQRSGAQRLLGIVPPALEGRDDLAFDDVRDGPERLLGLRVTDVHWFSTYQVSHRVADTFRAGRVFVAGDAGHIHSPVGGQGMNTGIGDAVNLAWKLAAVLDGRAGDRILATYDQERLPFAHQLVGTTDALFGPMVSESWWASFLRTKVFPATVGAATHLPGLPRRLFERVSQTQIAYTESDLARGRAGGVRGGDRLPWVEAADNYAPLASLDWQVHVFGEAEPAVRDRCDALGLPLHTFAWGPEAEDAGFREGALTLVRPDSYVGLAAPAGDAGALDAYAARLGLTFQRV